MYRTSKPKIFRRKAPKPNEYLSTALNFTFNEYHIIFFPTFGYQTTIINTMENRIKLLIVKFQNRLTHDEIKLFRGAVIHGLSQKNILYHNHMEEGFRYSYPLIQYKRIRNCAAIICLNEGTEVIEDFFSSYQPHFMIGNHPVTMKIDKLNPVFSCIEQTDKLMVTYHLTRWLPLNGKNYQTYNQLEGIGEQILFLEKILVANILACAKGLHIHLDKQLVCKIQKITGCYPVTHKTIKFMAFDLIFTTNILLPDYIGIGKNASMDCGIIVQTQEIHKKPIQ